MYIHYDIIQNTPILLEHDEKQNSLLVKYKFTGRLMRVYTTTRNTADNIQRTQQRSSWLVGVMAGAKMTNYEGQSVCLYVTILYRPNSRMHLKTKQLCPAT